MPRGKVKWFNDLKDQEKVSPSDPDPKGFGFVVVQSDTSKDVFFRGVQRALDLGRAIVPHYVEVEAQAGVAAEADSKSLGEDWRSVGADLLAAMNEHTRHSS